MMPQSDKACKICGDTEPFHVHNQGERIEDYFIIGRGQSDFDAAQVWKRKYHTQKRTVGALEDAIDFTIGSYQKFDDPVPMHLQMFKNILNDYKNR